MCKPVWKRGLPRQRPSGRKKIIAVPYSSCESFDIGMKPKKPIEDNASKLRELNDAIQATIKDRNKSPAHKEKWSEACREFHSSYDQQAFPGGLGESMQKLAKGDAATIESAVQFIEADPMFFRSGYIKEEILKHLSRNPLNDDQKQRLREIILERVRDTRTRREFRRYCRLAPIVNNSEFEAEITKLAGSSGTKPKHAQWVLDRIKQARANSAKPQKK